MNGSQVTASQQVTLGGSAAMPDSSWSIAAIGDFNGDGKSDMLWRNTIGSLIDWTMNGSQITSAQQVTFGASPVSLDSSWQIVTNLRLQREWHLRHPVAQHQWRDGRMEHEWGADRLDVEVTFQKQFDAAEHLDHAFKAD